MDRDATTWKQVHDTIALLIDGSSFPSLTNSFLKVESILLQVPSSSFAYQQGFFSIFYVFIKIQISIIKEINQYQHLMSKKYKANWHQFLSSLELVKEKNDVEYIENILETDRLEKNFSQIHEHVPLKFNSELNYQKIWKKFFFQEAKAQILKSKENEGSKPQLIEFIQITQQNSQFKVFSFERNQKRDQKYLPSSLVILSPIKPKKHEYYTHLLGYIEEGANINIRVRMPDELRLTHQQQWKLMTTTKKWYIQNICSLVSLQREFMALQKFCQLNEKLKDIILRPDQHNKELEKKFKIPLELDKKLKQVYNESQYKAISECLKKSGITLIQGPPGTGKTKTVLGTLSVLLNSYQKDEEDFQPLTLSWKKSAEVRKQSRKLEPWLQPNFVDWRDEPLIQFDDDDLNLTKLYRKCDETDKEIIIQKKKENLQLPGKILICGPSNASVDEIIRKLIKDNLYVSDGSLFLPNFVRIGDNYDKSLKKYALETLAQNLASKQKSTDLSYCKEKILKDYRIIFGTLSSAGSQVIENAKIKFDTVIIDEAGQSIQVSNLIPLIGGCERLILIGDPNQLPATVFNRTSVENHYDQSLFERMMKCDYPVSILKTQYRMHPDISHIIGKHFYGQKLMNSQSIIAEESIIKHCFCMFHVEESAQIWNKRSFSNQMEANAIKSFISFIGKHYNDIGLLSPYSKQIELLESLSLPKKCQIKTIDSFQGRQKDLIVLSCVRSNFVEKDGKIIQNHRKSIGFVSDFRRINVGLSRAKRLCIIFGDMKRLKMNQKWKNIIVDAQKRGQLFEYKPNKGYWNELTEKPKKYLINIS